MGTNGEYSWEQTYTGRCSIGSTRPVHEVEYVLRDMFTSTAVRVRDVRATLVFSIEVSDDVAHEVYYLHLVARGVPHGRAIEDTLDVMKDGCPPGGYREGRYRYLGVQHGTRQVDLADILQRSLNLQ
ncbi:hypothetical protein RU639_013551 [Aspergillus parasiticus]